MNKKQANSFIKFFMIFILIQLFPFFSLTKAQDLSEESENNTLNTNPKRVRFEPPNRGAPGNRRMAASRNECPNVEGDVNELIALIPGQFFSKTISDKPDFWFYIPYDSDEVIFLEFEIFNSSKKSFYATSLELRETPGIIKVSLPENKSLKSEELYTWTFTLHCNPAQLIKISSFLRGTIEYIEMSSELQSQIEKATLSEQVLIYSSEGIWSDSLTILAELRRENPNDELLLSYWTDLLKAVRLDELVEESIVSCCTSNELE